MNRSKTKRGFPTLLRRLRDAKGFTQAMLGKRAGLSQTVVSDLERSRLAPSDAALKRLAKALGVTVGVLAGKEGAA